MYRLPQAGLLAQELLEEQLSKQGFTKWKIVPGLWKLTTRLIQFTLVIDNYGMKFVLAKKCKALVRTLAGILQGFNGLERGEIHWTHLGLGPWLMGDSHVHARICAKSMTPFSTSKTSHCARFPVSTPIFLIWSNHPVCWNWWWLPTPA